MKTKIICLSVICATVLLIGLTVVSGRPKNEQAENIEVFPGQSDAETFPAQSAFVILPENEEVSPDFIFYAWETDPSGKNAENGIRNAVYQDVSHLQNVFAIPSAYAQAGETFELPLCLCGNVNLCAFDLQIAYDSNLLRYAGCGESDENLLVNCDHKNGVLYINFLRIENLVKGFQLCMLSFQTLTSISCESVLQLEVKEAVALDGEGNVILCNAFSTDSHLYLNV